MYKKYLIVASNNDKAGTNITTILSQFRQNPLLSSVKEESNFDFYLINTEIVDDSGINKDKIDQYDFIIFASKHKSEKKEKTLSIHSVGNWGAAQLGGKTENICPTSALFQKQLFETLDSTAREHGLDKNYKITLECTHHGPLIEKPCIFIEIGSTETEWNDKRAAFVVAKTISKTIKNFKENPYNGIAIGIGGPHYCPNFNKLQLKSNVAISYVIPEYALPLKEDMLKQAVKKTEEEVDFIVLDWKGVGGAEQRQETIKLIEKNYLQWKKTSDISR